MAALGAALLTLILVHVIAGEIHPGASAALTCGLIVPWLVSAARAAAWSGTVSRSDGIGVSAPANVRRVRAGARARRGGMMFKAIAWATDGSPPARIAFATAKNLARVTDARLVVLHVQELGVIRAGFLVEANDHLLVALGRTVEQLRTEGNPALERRGTT